MATSMDAEVTALAHRIAELSADGSHNLVRSSWWGEHMLEWAMSHPSFRTQLFRFVDVFPATTDDADVMRHLDEYFEGPEVPKTLDLALGAADHLPFGKAAAAVLARRNITRIAEQFIVGSGPDEAAVGLARLWRRGSAFTVDLLGEKTVTDAEADRYAARAERLLRVLCDATSGWAPDDLLEHDDLGPLPRVNLSVKPTALAPRFAALTRRDGLVEAKARLRPLLRHARDNGGFVNLDAEHYEVKDLTLQLLRELLDEQEFVDTEAGVVIQAYLRDSFSDLSDVIAYSGARSRPLTVRLVKGAYWDSEVVLARAEGWPVPVYERKEETDANYERCVRLLHDHHGEVRAAFGSHNLRSLAYAIEYANERGIPGHGFEIQMLYGMAEPVHAAIRRLGYRHRVYAPVGDLVPGMAYLVRRLLENTANESFLRQRHVDGRDLTELLEAPVPGELPGPAAPPPPRPTTDPRAPDAYRPEPVAEWRRATTRAVFGAAVSRAGQSVMGRAVPAVIDGRAVSTEATIISVDPADPTSVVARAASCGPDEADAALDAARRAWPAWARTSARERAGVVFGAAGWMRARRAELAALEVFEAGKPWKEADGDVCEAIDFCEYYVRQALRLAAGGDVVSAPGERNALHYRPRGVGVVVSPWNFPLAIPTGMVVAALVTGNSVLFKPAEQTPAVAAALVDALQAAGLPPGVLGFLPGVGEEVGAYLVEHPDVAFIAFTGSKAVGLGIVEAAAVHRPGQRHVKRVVAEMGGKNALVVDADADLDQAVPIILASAFGYAGQKCSAASRLIVVDAVHDRLVERLIGAAGAMRIGHPRDMAVDVGPLIDADARARVLGYVRMAPDEGEVVLHRDDVPEDGFFVGPTIVTGVAPGARLETEEIFGPVLTVMRARDLEHAIALANDSEYALTAGVLSRSPAHIDMAIEELRAGNVYVNRAITGAVVGRQPFGGYGLSGVGSKAGGPDYLLQYVDPRAVTENTLRQGFVPSEDGDR